MKAVNPGRLIHLADNEPRDQLSLGSTVSVVKPTLNEVENLVFVFDTIPARVEVVEVKGRSGDDFMRVAKVPGPNVRSIFEPPRGKGTGPYAGLAADSRGRDGAGHRTVAAPCFKTHRTHGNSNLHALREGFRCLRLIALERLRGYYVAPA